jgi:hypothetical protein
LDWRDPGKWAPEHYAGIATGLTGTVLQITACMQYPPVERIDISTYLLRLPERPYRDFDTQVDDTFGSATNLFFGVYKSARQREEQALAAGGRLPVHDLSLTALRLGDDVAILTNPAELFCEFGLEIKQNSPVKYTLVSELTNGAMGYVPTRQAFEEGGYEIRKLAGNSFLAMDAGERIVDASLSLLRNFPAWSRAK